MNSKNVLMILSGTLVVVLGLIGYILYSQSKTPTKKQTTDVQAVQLEQQSDSDTTDSIEKDLNDTDLTNIDKESTSIQAEINSTN